MGRLELIVDVDAYRRLCRHLSSSHGNSEEAAFLFCDVKKEPDLTKLVLAEAWLLSPDAFASRSTYYLELSDEARASLIKHAHDLSACLVEVHSHPGQVDAQFSLSDLKGFEEFVPHVRWRLKGRPYVAIVHGSNDFDALAWHGQSAAPDQLGAIVVGVQRLSPNGRTLAEIRRTA